MEKVVIQANKRKVTGKKVKVLRREGKLPAVIYGHATDPISIVLDTREASKTLAKASSSTLVTIDLEGKEYPAIVREKQLDFIRNSLIHVDFLAVSMTEKITASVGIQFVGDSPAAKDFGAVLVTGLTEIEVECLPADLPEDYVVDVSSLAEIGDGIYVKDLDTSEKVEILSNIEDMIVVSTAPKVEEIVEEVEEELLEGEEVLEGEEEPGEPEVIEKGKGEEEREEDE